MSEPNRVNVYKHVLSLPNAQSFDWAFFLLCFVTPLYSVGFLLEIVPFTPIVVYGELILALSFAATLYERLILLLVFSSIVYLLPELSPGILAIYVSYRYLGNRALAATFLVLVTASYVPVAINTVSELTQQIVPNTPINVYTLAYLLSIALIAGAILKEKLRLNRFVLLVLVWVVLTHILASNEWIHANQMSSGAYVLGSLSVILWAVKSKSWREKECARSLKPSVLSLCLAAVVVLILAANQESRSIKRIIFDESHGPWETVRETFSPEDFGRAHYYNYRKLYEWLKKTGFSISIVETEINHLDIDDILIIKLPTEEFTNSEVSYLDNWLKNGGRLLLIVDHTDLYDHSQILNKWLKQYDITVESKAVYNRIGFPTVVQPGLGASVLGRIDNVQTPYAWQTGTTVDTPLLSLPLGTYGASYSEYGDYSKPNRFSDFTPDRKKAFYNHTSIGFIPIGRGGIYTLNDSTPWSNFSVFKDPYLLLFKKLLVAVENINYINIILYLKLVSGVMLLGLVCGMRLSPDVMLAFPMTVALSTLLLSVLTFDQSVKLKQGEEYNVVIEKGHGAAIEYLDQLVTPGVANYARITSSLAKYHLWPIIGCKRCDREPSKVEAVVYLEVDGESLPRKEDLISRLRAGQNLIFIFSKEDAGDEEVRTYLNELDLYINYRTVPTIGQSLLTDIGYDGLIEDQPSILVTTIPFAGARASSLLRERNSNLLAQQFTARPTTFPQQSGVLTVSFLGLQFSDEAVGSVWEGIHPTTSSRLREGWFFEFVKGRPTVATTGEMLGFEKASVSERRDFDYLAYKDGVPALSGRIRGDEQLTALERYLSELHESAIQVHQQCEKGECERVFYDRNIFEWRLENVELSIGSGRTTEIIHERTHPGYSHTWNLIFVED